MTWAEPPPTASLTRHLDPGQLPRLVAGSCRGSAWFTRGNGPTPSHEEGQGRFGHTAEHGPDCPASWARLISKIYQVDPLRCRGCGGKLQIVAYINDHFAIKKILDHLGLLPDEQKRSPPEIRYVPVDDEGRELVAMVPGLQTP